MEKRYMIEDVRRFSSAGCNPCSYEEDVCVRYNDGEGSKWLFLCDCDGFYDFYHTDEDVVDKVFVNFMEDNAGEIQSMWDRMHIDSLDGFDLSDTDDLQGSIEKDKENPVASLIWYIMLLVRSNGEGYHRLVREGVGHYADSIVRWA